MNTDDARAEIVLAEVCHCASLWENGARLLGNVRAGDIQRAAAAGAAAIEALEKIQRAHAPLGEAIRMVLRGFDEGVFVRSTDGDRDPAWAIRLFPFIRAIGVLQASLGEGTTPIAEIQSPALGKAMTGAQNSSSPVSPRLGRGQELEDLGAQPLQPDALDRQDLREFRNDNAPGNERTDS